HPALVPPTRARGEGPRLRRTRRRAGARQRLRRVRLEPASQGSRPARGAGARRAGRRRHPERSGEGASMSAKKGAEERPLAVVVLAAGQGTRMKSAHAKVLHCLGGLPLIQHVLRAAEPLGADRIAVVVGHQAQAVEQACAGFDAQFALQAEQRGTGHAVAIAGYAELGDFDGDVLVLYGDVPLLTTESLRRLIAEHHARDATLSLLTTIVEDPTGYGRIVRDAAGALVGIVEERDATPEQRRIREINPGIYCVRSRFLFPALERLRPDNAQGELYLTD